jgi:dTDP-glucose 4,6-dehydratase
MSRIIVTGGLGFIGSHFVNYINNNTNHEVLIVDKITYAANRKNIQKNTPLLEKDICDVTPEDLGEYDYIVHFAAESHVDNSIKDGLPFVKTNVQGTFNLLEVVRKNKKLIKFLHISTDEVYGDMDDYKNISDNYRANEGEKLNPSSYYSATKTASDLLVMSANRTFGLPYLITRTCNNYGENQHHEKFIPKIIHSIKNGLEVPVYGDGNQIREWIHADDNSKAIYNLLVSEKVNQIYNIGSWESYTNNEIIQMVGEIIGKEVKFKYVEDRLGHDRKYSLNCFKYRIEFDEIQNIKLKDWLKKYILN